jgi:hypothetical protein
VGMSHVVLDQRGVVVEQLGVRERRLGDSQKVVFGDLYFLVSIIGSLSTSQPGRRTNVVKLVPVQIPLLVNNR